MTSRPFTECRKPVSATVALVLLLAMAMAAGCADQGISAKHPLPQTSANPTIPLTDRELAEQLITDAEEQINNTDSVIAWFKGNASTKDDSQLPGIMTKREIAVSYVVTTEDQIAQGNFTGARVSALKAYANATESNNDALRRQDEIWPHCRQGYLPCM